MPLALLCVLAFVLHGSALQGYWRWDDGQHLFHVSMYTPGSVFLDPEVTRAVSGNQLAPWNLFMYQVNHALFGLNPLPYYVHHLLSLAGAAAALYLLLRHWLPRWQALLPAALLLAGAPSTHMAQQLMVGHYVDGLSFACLGLWAYVYAVQRAQWRWAWLATGFYLLSTLCKEVYVPWVALYLLLPLPAGSPSGMARWRHAAPILAVALGYAVLRISVFSGLGGHHGTALTGWHALPAFMGDVAQVLRQDLLGSGVLGTAAGLLCLACAAAGIAAQPSRRRLWVLVGMGAALVVVVFPLIFVVHPGTDLMGLARYLWVPWVALCVVWGLPWPARLARWRAAALFIIAAAVLQQSYTQREYDRPANAIFDTHYAFVLKPPPGQILVPDEFSSAISTVSQIMYAHAAYQRLRPQQPLAEPALLRQMPADAAERARVRVWSGRCLCLVPLDSLPPAQQESVLQAQLANVGQAFPMGGRPPRLAHGYGGAIDAVTVKGRQLLVSGWTPTLGAGRKLLIAASPPDYRVSLDAFVSTERPDVAQAFQRQDMLHSGFEATLGFSDERMAQAASSSIRCALVQSHLPGQGHQHLLLPVKGRKDCNDALVPDATRADKAHG